VAETKQQNIPVIINMLATIIKKTKISRRHIVLRLSNNSLKT